MGAWHRRRGCNGKGWALPITCEVASLVEVVIGRQYLATWHTTLAMSGGRVVEPCIWAMGSEWRGRGPNAR